MLGCEPYISGNVGSGTVEELAKWVEYMTSDGDTPMAKLRRQNGRDKAWKVKFLGVGNESWGCGGDMRPEYYADLYRRYAVYCRNYDGNRLYKIASGASDYDYNWTKVLMNNIGHRMHGLSLHYYTVTGWTGSKGSATNFDKDQYYWTIGKCLEIEDVIKKHKKIMDDKDPKKRIGLLVDEWGTWWDEEPGTIRGHLYQQNALRDAFVAALSLNVFHRHTDRVRMANIAQIVNVLQSMILTDQKGTGHMVLTPTYHVFEMYKGFQEATYLPMDVTVDSMKVRDNRIVPLVNTSAAKQTDGSIIISLSNIDVENAHEMTINLNGYKAKEVAGRILTSKDITDYNDFENPNKVSPVEFKGAKLKKNVLTVKLPAKSIVVLNVK
jgi:alpha-N-arabinofuranosidase